MLYLRRVLARPAFIRVVHNQTAEEASHTLVVYTSAASIPSIVNNVFKTYYTANARCYHICHTSTLCWLHITIIVAIFDFDDLSHAQEGGVVRRIIPCETTIDNNGDRQRLRRLRMKHFIGM